MAKINIIVPIYKVEKYLCRCVNSILVQTLSDYELILNDDGSSDNCSCICDEYASKDSRVIVIHKSNGGLSDARNVGIDWSFFYSSSVWITFLDSDDWVHPKYLEYLYTVAMMTNCKVSVCGYQKTKGDAFFEPDDSFNYKIMDVEIFYCQGDLSFIVAWGKLYKKELFENLRYPVNKLHEDEYVTYKILFSLNQIALVQHNFYFYFYNEDSITANWSPKRLDSLEALRNQIVFFQDNGYVRAYNKSIINAAMNISKNYIQINETECIIGKEKYKKILSSELKSIFRYKGAKRILPFTQYQYLYEIAYPKLMKYYWCMKSLKSKIIRIIKYQLLVLLF